MGFSLAIRWSVPRLLNYLQFHLREKVTSGTIHPMLTLAVARRVGLPWLISDAVGLLAQSDRLRAEWSLDYSILRWSTTEELSVIAKMKEALWKRRRMMAAVPNAHHCNRCSSNEQAKNHCESAWSIHWLFKIQKYIIGKHSDSSSFGAIKRIIEETPVLGMDGDCRKQTVTAVIGRELWRMEEEIVAEAVTSLMVRVALIDGQDGVKEIERIN